MNQKSETESGREMLSLNGDDWSVVDAEPGKGEHCRFFADGFSPRRGIRAQVPGDVHADLERAGRLPPLYVGLNSLRATWVPRREWWWRRKFRVPSSWGSRMTRLHFEGVDYKCDVWLNGHKLGSHEGALTGFSFDVAGRLRVERSNTLVVLIHPGPAIILDLLYFQRGCGWDHQYAHDQMTRTLKYWKCRTVTGWDWGTPIWTMGIWRNVSLVVSNGATLSDMRILPRLAPPYHRARLSIRVHAESSRPRKVVLLWRVRSVTDDAPEVSTRQEHKIPATGTEIACIIPLREPRLWWPNGLGKQHLYELTLQVLDIKTGTLLDEISQKFGVRALTCENNPGSGLDKEYNDIQAINDWDYGAVKSKILPDLKAREKLRARINGQPVFLRGGNWIPCDLLYGRADRSRYERLLRLAVGANFNFLRVWGGGLIEKPEFYELCDQLGIAIVQEFPHAGRRPLETKAALKADAEQTRAALKELVNHPCVMRYGFGNELYLDRSTSNQVRQFEQICQEEDPTRPALGPDPITTAQRHGPHWFYFHEDYGVYNTGLPLTVGPRIPASWTEYGAAGMSSVETIRSMMPREHQWPIHSENPYWQWHKAFGALGHERWLDRDNYRSLFGDLPDLETECRCSQWAQAEGVRYANQSHRRAAWQRSECTIWSFNEPWPNAAHGCIVEYSGLPKMAYYYTKSSFAPIDVSAEYDGIICRVGRRLSCRFWVTSDRPDPVPGCVLNVTHSGLDGGIVFREKWTVNVEPKGSCIVGLSGCVVPAGKIGDVLLTRMELTDRNGKLVASQVYTFGIATELPAPGTPIKGTPLRVLLKAPTTKLELRMGNMKPVRMFGEELLCRRVEVRNVSCSPALFVSIKIEGVEPALVRLTDNYFCLFGGEKKEIGLSLPRAIGESAATAVTAQGWNTPTVKCRLTPHPAT